MRLRPALAALEHREGSRIFQDKSAGRRRQGRSSQDAGVDEHVEWRLRQTYAPREFLCQYRETRDRLRPPTPRGRGHLLLLPAHDSAATDRLRRRPGRLRHARRRTKPVLAPRQGGGPGTQPLAGSPARQDPARRPASCSATSTSRSRARPPRRRCPRPASSRSATTSTRAASPQAEGSRRARARISSAARRRGRVPRQEPRRGARLRRADDRSRASTRPFLNGDFVVAELSSRASTAARRARTSSPPSRRTRPSPPPAAPRSPRIRGVQTAVVTGPSNEPQAIHVDKYGRIKVRFLWDRSAKQDDTSSCGSASPSSAMGGSMILPRVGWEVDRRVPRRRSGPAHRPRPHLQRRAHAAVRAAGRRRRRLDEEHVHAGRRRAQRDQDERHRRQAGRCPSRRRRT